MAEAQAKDDFELAVEADKKAYQDEIQKEVEEQRAQNERARAAVAAARKQREPEWEELKKRQSEYEAVPTPKLEKPPPPPNSQEMLKPTTLQKTVGMASVFALLSVGLAKGQGIYGLKALGGFMEGAHKGNVEQANAALKDFNNNMEYVRATNEYALAQYNAIIGNKKYSLEVQDRMFRQKALEMEDELSIQQLEQGGMNAVHVRLRDLAKMNHEFNKELDRHKQIQGQLTNYSERTQKMGAGGAGGGVVPDTVFGIPLEDIPKAPPGEKNEAFLSMLSPARADMVRRVASNDIDLKTFGGMGRQAANTREQYATAATLYDPSYKSRTAGVMEKAEREGTPGGPVGRNELAINTLAHHIDQWDTAMKKLNNSQLQRWNTTSNRVRMEFGDPALQRAQVPAGIAAAELARIVKGGTAAPTQDEIQYWEGVFNTSSSPQQVKEVIWSALEASGGRLVSIEEAYKRGSLKRRVLTPESRALLMKHKPKGVPTPSWLKSDPSDLSDLEKKAELTPERRREIAKAAREKVGAIMRSEDTDGRPMHVDPTSGRWVYD